MILVFLGILGVVFGKLVKIYLTIFIGFLLTHFNIVTADMKKKYAWFVMNIVVPVLVFLAIASMTLSFTWGLGLIVLVALITTLSSFLTAYLLLKNRQVNDFKLNSTILNVASFPNALNYPFPIILALVGPEGLVAATLFVFVQIVLRNTFGVIISVESTDWRVLIKKLVVLVKFPPFLSVLVAIAYRSVFGILIIKENTTLSLTRDITIILMILVVGLNLQVSSIKRLWDKHIAYVLISRFLPGIAVSILLYPFLGNNVFLWVPVFIQLISPSAVSNTVYAEYFDLDAELTSLSIIATTIIALLILPFQVFWIITMFPFLAYS